MRHSQMTAAVLAATIALALPVDALAQVRPITGNDRNLSASDVDKVRTNVLLVQKVAQNPNDDVPAGQKPPAVEGSLFTLSRVNGIDITADAGRELAGSMQLDDAKSRGLTKIATKATNAEGAVEFADIKSGLYLLEESAPDNDHEYHLSSPKLMLLPLADVTGEHFTYDNVVVMKWDRDSGVPTWRTSTPPPPATTSSTPDTPGTSTTRTPSRTTSTEPGTKTTSPGSRTSTTTTPTAPQTIVTTGPDGRTSTIVRPAGNTPGTPGGGSRSGGLAYTGANVLWAGGLGALLILMGILLARRNTHEQTR